MSEETEEVVKVLYDYCYSDDGTQINIQTGDIYRLIEKTNDEWWQVYDPSDADGESFFVPAQYVKIVSDHSPYKAVSDLDKLLTFGEPSRLSPVPDYDDGDDQRVERVNNLAFGQDSASVSGGDPDGEYVNLEKFREAAGIPNPTLVVTELDNVKDSVPSAVSPNLAKTPAISQELIQGTIPPPLPEEGDFVRVLVEGMSWDIYKEHTAGRLYYVNRDTGERMWKPPRKDKPSSTSEQQRSGLSSPTSPSTSQTKEDGWSGIPAEYEQVHDNGSVYFIHKSTQEKWKSLVDQVGRQYFHKLGSGDTQWNLPSSPLHSSKESLLTNEHSVQPKDTSWETQGNRLSTFGGQSMRAVKAMSTYGQLETAGVGNKASTLPANFTVARPAPVAHERNVGSPQQRPTHLAPSNSTGSLPNQEETYSGYLNKAKIAEVGKKKMKKTWSQIYVVLQGSNLVFYKDQKSATQKPGSPYGRPEGVVSLQGAHVDFSPPKDFTSKKNTILLHTSAGSMFLFQCDNEKIIREWFTRMKIIANDVTPSSDSSPRESDEHKGMTRSISADEGSSGSLQGVDKNKNLIGIKAKLLSLISRRPSQDDLVKRGIIKDAVFGSKLHELCDKEKVHVPKFVHSCIAAVESKGLQHDGIYRISGNMAEIQKLRCAVDKDDTYNLYDPQWDIHVLTGALKLFFRELKEPLYPFHMYNKFIDAIKKESRKDKISAFKSAVHDLPRCNYHTLKELFQHLRKVVDLSHQNRMQPQNIAIVFGPTLMWQKEEGGSLAVQTVFQSKIVEFTLLECSELFK